MLEGSVYPDGTINPAWNQRQFELIVPERRETDGPKLRPSQVDEIVCHRRVSTDHEQYLVKWEGDFKNPIFSWHYLNELSLCLLKVQNYLECFKQTANYDDEIQYVGSRSKKRKFSEDEESSRSSSTSRSPSSSFTHLSNLWGPFPYARSFNGKVEVEEDGFKVKELTHGTKSNDVEIVITSENLPTPGMLENAKFASTGSASHDILTQFKRQLWRLPGPIVRISNDLDQSVPPLNFEFISSCVLREGVRKAHSDTVTGCGQDRGGCRPDMGSDAGCEYSSKCECMEYATVDKARLKTAEEWSKFHRGETKNLPKVFPYYKPTTRHGPRLRKFYIDSRHPIYECNERCNCGPNCKTRLVQHGRQVRLEIFKTKEKGWGLKCLDDLKEGEFIDTYRGEVITNKEADRREENSSDAKANYLFALDKFVGDGGITSDNCYVIDGQYKGGPTRFMNHSCAPNCRIFSVSYNRHDPGVYELAFFATKAIPAGTELTFHYTDREEGDEDEDEGQEDPSSQASTSRKLMDCKCGAENCKGQLWN